VIPLHVVIVVLLCEAAAVLVGIALIVGHGGVLAVRDRRQRPRLIAARGELAAALQAGTTASDPPAAVTTLRAGVALQLLGDLAPSLAGGQRRQLTVLAQRLGLLQRAEQQCASRRWTRRLRGARTFTTLGGGDDVVPALLDDPHPDVRAQAAEWAAEHPVAPVIAELVVMLNDPQNLCRFTVEDSLLRIGRPAIRELSDCLDRASGESATAVLSVAVGLPDPRFLPAALRLSEDPVASARALAAQLLGALGGADAAARLEALLHDENAAARAAAATAVGRLGHWRAAPTLAGLLRDPVWDVRRAAGLALRATGAPGTILLRRAKDDEDRFASDMARQVLDLPDGTPVTP
jgi:hypothetical protein